MTGTIVILDWSSQASYPLYRSMLVKEPLVIRPNSNLLISPNRDPHPLWWKLSLVLTMLFANRFGYGVLPKNNQKLYLLWIKQYDRALNGGAFAREIYRLGRSCVSVSGVWKRN